MARLLQRSRRHVFALIRAPNDADAHQRLRAVLATAFGDADASSGRVTAVAGDIECPALGLDPRAWTSRPSRSTGCCTRRPQCRSSSGSHMLGFADRARAGA